MDHNLEQEMELEALEAILMDDLQPYSGSVPDDWPTHGKTFSIVVHSVDDTDDVLQEEYTLELLFAHTPQYPEEPPGVQLHSVKGLSDADLAQANDVVQQQIQENLGMAMIFNLVSALKDWLLTKAQSDPDASLDPEQERRKRDAEEEAKRAAARAHGTHVTVETFARWKAAFDAELAAKRQSLADAGKDEKAGRLTGKAWFLRQAADGAPISEDDEAPLSEDDEEDFHLHERIEAGEEDEDEDFDYDDDDDEGLLEDYLAAKCAQ